MPNFRFLIHPIIQTLRRLPLPKWLPDHNLFFLGSLLAFAIVLLAGVYLIRCGGGADNLRGFHRTPSERLSPSRDEPLPEPRREFRAAWVATVNNIDWPSRPGLPVEEQKNEAIAILDRLVALNMNAVIFQVRPQADAIYASKIEPWSYFLTGQQGLAPQPAWDPLAFWTDQAHLRGLQIHAWFNPFRANHKGNKGEISGKSIVKAKPHLVVPLGEEGYWWMIPTIPEAREHSLRVILDVVHRYDIDGVHFDDYFYPYPAYNQNRDFPDQENYQAYRNEGGSLDLASWRREAVNLFIRETALKLRQLRDKKIEFGISPFGIWRPQNPPGITGMDSYNVLYADSKKWINEGWADYIMPQLYWPVGQPGQDFSLLLDWWKQQNRQQRHLWPGLSLDKASTPETAAGIALQVERVRQSGAENAGTALFSMRHLLDPSSPVAQVLQSGPWSEPALLPPVPWLDDTPPLPPRVELWANPQGDGVVRFDPGKNKKDIFQFVLHEKADLGWLPPRIIPATRRFHAIRPGVSAIAVRCVNRKRNLSEPHILRVR